MNFVSTHTREGVPHRSVVTLKKEFVPRHGSTLQEYSVLEASGKQYEMNIVVGVASEFKARFNIAGVKVDVEPVTFHFDHDLPTITCQLVQTGITSDEVVCSSKQFDFGTSNGGNLLDLWKESLLKKGKFKAADKSGHEKSHCLGFCDEVVIVITLADGRTFRCMHDATTQDIVRKSTYIQAHQVYN